MQRLKLDSESPVVRQFVRKLRPKREGLELEFKGETICKVFPADYVPPLDPTKARERLHELLRKSRGRNKGVSARVITREVQEAIDTVRGRQK